MLRVCVNSVVDTGEVLDMLGVVLIYLDFNLVFFIWFSWFVRFGYLFAVVWLLRFCCLLRVFACVWCIVWIVCCD